MVGLIADDWSFICVLHRDSQWLIFTVIPEILALKGKINCKFWSLGRGSLDSSDNDIDMDEVYWFGINIGILFVFS